MQMVSASSRPPRSPFADPRFLPSITPWPAWALPALFLCFLAGTAQPALARQARNTVPATVVETAEYTPCGNRCSEAADPARAFCLRAGGQTLVGEGRSYIHEARFSGMEDYGGRQVRIRFTQRWIWIQASDGTQTRIRRGTQYEEFKDRACVAEVNRPILAAANRQKRPARVPPDALAIPGPEQGVNPQRFLWYACALSPGAATITCRRWYHNGESFGDDWYCAKTLDGNPVGENFSIDPLESDAGHLVLTTGGVLEHDQRSRIDGKLDRPDSPCY